MNDRPYSRYFSKTRVSYNKGYYFGRRQIDYTGWDLVFTKHGRYFFYDTVEKLSKWCPPEHLLEYLLDLPSERLSLLFNPYEEYPLDFPEEDPYQFSPEEEQEGEGEEQEGGKMDEGEQEQEGEEEEEERRPQIAIPTTIGSGFTNENGEEIFNSPLLPGKNHRPKEPRANPEERQVAIEAFKVMLLEREELDPFQSWEILQSQLSQDPRFQMIPNEKERKSIFDSVCPELAERARKIREKQLKLAEESWRETLRTLCLSQAPTTWTEFSRRVKKESWYKLLDSKIMEKEYRARLTELRNRNIVYRIPK